jgi:hypothetical protein
VIVEKNDGAFAMSHVAIVIAIDEVRSDFSQVARSDWLIAHHTQGSRTGLSAIYQDESHVAPPNVKQNTISPALRRRAVDATIYGRSLDVS